MVIFNAKFIKMEKNLYEELGLKKNATRSEIKFSSFNCFDILYLYPKRNNRNEKDSE